MAVGLNTGVPWVMCKEDDAPDPVASHLFLFTGAEIYQSLNINGNFWL